MPIISPKIPEGLPELMRDLAKQVIKENPENIYEFAAEYFENLLRKRDGDLNQGYKKFATYKVYRKNKSARSGRDRLSAKYDKGDESGESSKSTDDTHGNSIIRKSITAAPIGIGLLGVNKLPSVESEKSVIRASDIESSISGANESIRSGSENDTEPEKYVQDDGSEKATESVASEKSEISIKSEIRKLSSVESVPKSEIKSDDEKSIELLDEGNSEKVENEENSMENAVDPIASEDDDVKNMVLDEEMEQAALKIQSAFRGHSVRKDIKSTSDTIQDNENTEEENDGINQEQCSLNEEIIESSDKELIDENQENIIENTSETGEKQENDNFAEIENNEAAEVQEDVIMEKSISGNEMSIEKIISQSEEMENDQGSEPENLEILKIDSEAEMEEAGDENLKQETETEVVTEDDEIQLTPAEDNDFVASLSEKEETEKSASIENGNLSGKESEIEGAEEENQEALENSEGDQEIETEKLNDKLSSQVASGECDSTEEFVEKQSISPSASHQELINESLEKPTSNKASHESAEIEKTQIDNVEENYNNEPQSCDEIMISEQNADIDALSDVLGSPQKSITSEPQKSLQMTESLEDLLIQQISNHDSTEKPKTISEEQEPTDKEMDEVQENVVKLNDEDDDIANMVFDDEMEAAATKIQATFKGHKARKEMKKGGEGESEISDDHQENEEKVDDSTMDVSPEDDDIANMVFDDEMEAAATKIQATFKGHKARKEMKKEVEGETETTDDNQENEKKVDDSTMDVSPEDDDIANMVFDDEMEAAATKIQATFKGHKARKEMKKGVEGETEITDDDKENETKCSESDTTEVNQDEEDIANMVFDDEMEKAATKIQATFKGHKTRKELKNVDTTEMEQQVSSAPEDDDIANMVFDDEMEKAATKIQATFKGHKTRKELIKNNNDDETDGPVSDEILEPSKEESDIPVDEPTMTQSFVSVVGETTSHDSKEEYPDAIDIDPERIHSNSIQDEVLSEIGRTMSQSETNRQSDEILEPGKEDSEIPESGNETEQQSVDEVDQPIITDDSVDKNIVDKLQSNESEGKENESENQEDVPVDQCKDENEADINDKILKSSEENQTETDTQNEEETEEVTNEEEQNETAEENEENAEEEVNENETEDKDNGGEEGDESEEDGEAEGTQEENQTRNDNLTDAEREEIENMVLDDEMEQAALKIQSTFRGHKTRKQVKPSEQTTSETEEIEKSMDDVNLEETEKESVEAQKGDNEDDDVANMVLDEEMEQAALKIQSTFRGHKTRKEIKETDNTEEKKDEEPDETQEENEDDDVANMVLDEEMEQAALKIQSTFRGHKTRKEIKDNEDNNNEEESNEKPEDQEQKNTDDDDVANMVLDEEMEQAALKIQSTFRGHKTRKENKQEDKPSEEQTDEKESDENEVPESNDDDDVANMVLDDEMEQAALKIQSVFRGHKTRSDLKTEDKTEEEGETEETEEEPKDENTEEQASTVPEKTEEQLKEEEEIANMVLDDEMEQAALRIQSTFRFKKKSKGPSDDSGDSSSAEDTIQQDDDDQQKSSETFQDEDITKSIDRSFDRPEAFYQQSIEGNEYRSGSDRLSDENCGLYENLEDSPRMNLSVEGAFDENNISLTGSAGSDDDKNPSKNSKDFQSDYEGVLNESNDSETGEMIRPALSLGKSSKSRDSDTRASINSAEAMYNSLKNEELECQKLLSENSEEKEEEDNLLGELETKQPIVKTKLIRGAMSLDDRKLYKDKILGLSDSILSQDYGVKSKDELDEFDPFSEASKRKDEFLDQIHGRSEYEKSYDGNMDMGDEDQFDDFYPGNIRQKILASSISIADSDYFDPNKISNTSDEVRTALETINSTDSDSTIVSAATKIQATARGFITRRRLQSTGAMSTSQYASFGNAAIDKSLDDFIERQEQLKEEDEEDELEISSKSSKKLDSVEDSVDESDGKNFGNGVIEIKLEQRKPDEPKEIPIPTEQPRRVSNLLYADDTAARRMLLHREDAVSVSSPSSDDSLKSPRNSCDKVIESRSTQETIVEIKPKPEELKRSVSKKLSKEESTTIPEREIKSKSMFNRQRTMPVQIDSSVIRVLPKHLRKRIRSADADKKKKTHHK